MRTLHTCMYLRVMAPEVMTQVVAYRAWASALLVIPESEGSAKAWKSVEVKQSVDSCAFLVS